MTNLTAAIQRRDRQGKWEDTGAKRIPAVTPSITEPQKRYLTSLAEQDNNGSKDINATLEHCWGIIHDMSIPDGDDDAWNAGRFPGIDRLTRSDASMMIDQLKTEQFAYRMSTMGERKAQGDKREFKEGERVHNDWLGQDGTVLHTTAKTATVQFDHEPHPRRIMKHNITFLDHDIKDAPQPIPTFKEGSRVNTVKEGPGTITGTDGRFATVRLDSGKEAKYLARFLKETKE